METMAYYAFWSGVLATAVALGAGLTYALVPRLAMRSAMTNIGTVQVPVVVAGPSWLKGGSQGMSWAAAAIIVAYMGFRWTASSLPPVSNMWEYTVAFGWAMVVGAGLVNWRYRAWGLSLLLLAGALILFAIAEAAFSSQIGSVPPHLQAKHLLALHASTMLVAFGAFGVAFAGAVGLFIREISDGPKWLPTKRVLEQISGRAATLGFPFYTLGLAVGAYWMNSLWGRYWDWDTKAASSLAAWLIFVAYFHAWNLRRWRSGRAPLLLVAGFGALMFSYFGVNLW